MAQQSGAFREAVGVCTSAGYLHAVVEEFLNSGFHRAELGLLIGAQVGAPLAKWLGDHHGRYLQKQVDGGGRCYGREPETSMWKSAH